MTSIQKIIEENEKEFEEKFPELLYFDGGHRDANQDNYTTCQEEVKSFLRSSHLTLIQKLIEEIKKINIDEMFAEEVKKKVIDYLK